MAPPPYRPIDPAQLNTYSAQSRSHKVDVDAFAGLTEAGCSMQQWLASWPEFLAANNFKTAVGAIVQARSANLPVVWALGAHVIKVGCAPIVIDLIRRGFISAVALNGATAIHDVEVALLGATSEEVSETIVDGSFGMVEETPAIFAEACKIAVAQRAGLGLALGQILSTLEMQYAQFSILAAAYEAEIPVTVHVALGTDTIHMHANANGAQIGQATLHDFRLISDVVRNMSCDAEGTGGVWCNIGSAVILPEVFLKAVAVARNLGANLDGMTTVNLDMIRHYRPSQNVVGRPVRRGKGLDIAGHHEIMLPLLRQAIIEQDNS